MALGKVYGTSSTYRKKKGTITTVRVVNSKRKSTSTMSKRKPFPNTRRFMTRYYDSNISVVTTHQPSAHVFRINNMYDIDYSTGAGDHQPIGFDQMALLYSRYRVTGVKYKINVQNLATVPVIVAVHHRTNITSVADVGTLIENGNCRYITLNAKGSGSNNFKTITGKWSAAEFFGKKQANDNDTSGFMANVACQEPAYLHVIAQPFDDSTACPIRFSIEFDIDSNLYDPKVLAQS